ncbi:hypothetical protein NW835_04510 [Synechococcus sp. OH2]
MDQDEKFMTILGDCNWVGCQDKEWPLERDRIKLRLALEVLVFGH